MVCVTVHATCENIFMLLNNLELKIMNPHEELSDLLGYLCPHPQWRQLQWRSRECSKSDVKVSNCFSLDSILWYHQEVWNSSADMQLIPCEGNRASCEILCTLTATCSLCAVCSGYFVWILESCFSLWWKQRAKLILFTCCCYFFLLIYIMTAFQKLSLWALPATLSALRVCTANTAKDCTLTMSEISR